MWKSHGEDNFHLIPQRREKGDGGKMEGDGVTRGIISILFEAWTVSLF